MVGAVPMIEQAEHVEIQRVLDLALTFRARAEEIDEDRLPPEVVSALDDAYFTLGDLKHACRDGAKDVGVADE